jgi:hypothetical protein
MTPVIVESSEQNRSSADPLKSDSHHNLLDKSRFSMVSLIRCYTPPSPRLGTYINCFTHRVYFAVSVLWLKKNVKQ